MRKRRQSATEHTSTGISSFCQSLLKHQQSHSPRYLCEWITNCNTIIRPVRNHDSDNRTFRCSPPASLQFFLGTLLSWRYHNYASMGYSDSDSNNSHSDTCLSFRADDNRNKNRYFHRVHYGVHYCVRARYRHTHHVCYHLRYE